MSDETKPSATEVLVSPTGTPILSPSVFKYIAIAVLILLAVLGVLIGFYPDVKHLQVAFALITAVGSVLGISSPGMRSVAKVLVLVFALAAVSSLTSCATLGASAERVGKATLNCAASEVAAGVPDALGAVRDALAGSTDQWKSQLDTIAVKAGWDVLVCAVKAVVTELEAQQSPPPNSATALYMLGQPKSNTTKLTRAGAYLEANGYK
jgi:hypothetical protein